MTTSSISLSLSSAFVAMVMCMFPRSAVGQGCADSPTVRRAGWVVDVSYQLNAGAQDPVEYFVSRVEHMAGTAGNTALVTARAAIKDGTSNTIFFAEKAPAVLSCDDVNRDGLAGISVLQFSLRDSVSGAVIPVAVIPRDGELDRAGEELATVVIGGLPLTASVRLSEPARPATQ